MSTFMNSLPKRFVALAAGLSMIFALAGSTQAATGSSEAPQQEEWGLSNYDSRDQITTQVVPTPAQAVLLAQLKGVSVDWDERFGTVASLVRYGRFLTPANAAAPKAVARDFVQRHAILFGLTPTGIADLEVSKLYKTAHNGATHVHFAQTDQGRDVFGSTLGLVINRRGRVVIAGGSAFVEAVAATVPLLTARQAVTAAAGHVGATVRTAPVVRSVSTDASRKTILTNTVARFDGARDISAELVTFPMPAGHAALLAWKTTIDVDASG